MQHKLRPRAASLPLGFDVFVSAVMVKVRQQLGGPLPATGVEPVLWLPHEASERATALARQLLRMRTPPGPVHVGGVIIARTPKAFAARGDFPGIPPPEMLRRVNLLWATQTRIVRMRHHSPPPLPCWCCRVVVAETHVHCCLYATAGAGVRAVCAPTATTAVGARRLQRCTGGRGAGERVRDTSA